MSNYYLAGDESVKGKEVKLTEGMETYQVVLLHLISELLELARKGGNLDWPAIEEEARAIQDLAARAIAGQPLTAELRENVLKRLKERYPGCHKG